MVSRRIKDLFYAIRDVAVLANEVKKSGKKVYHLNIGDPIIFDFMTPEYITRSMVKAALSGKNFYVDSLGVEELRNEIRSLESHKNSINLKPDDILVTSGVTEGIFFILANV